MMKSILAASLAVLLASSPVLGSHTIANSGKSGQKFLVTDMFWSGIDCAGIDMTFTLVSPPQNGTVTQRKAREALNSTRLQISPPAKCDGRKLPISYVFYQSKKGFKGTDSFTVMWTNAEGATRQKTYSVTID